MIRSLSVIGTIFAFVLSTSAFSAGPEYTIDELLDRLEEADMSIEEAYVLADSACEGSSIGAECRIIIDDGVEFGIGFCVEIPGDVSGGLTCEINIPEMGCQSFSFADPALGFGLLMLLGFGIYRRRKA